MRRRAAAAPTALDPGRPEDAEPSAPAGVDPGCLEHADFATGEYSLGEDFLGARSGEGEAPPGQRETQGPAAAQQTPGEEAKVEEGRTRCQRYVLDHVQRVQEMKQHHVHTFKSKNERVPLTHCRRPYTP